MATVGRPRKPAPPVTATALPSQNPGSALTEAIARKASGRLCPVSGGRDRRDGRGPEPGGSPLCLRATWTGSGKNSRWVATRCRALRRDGGRRHLSALRHVARRLLPRRVELHLRPTGLRRGQLLQAIRRQPDRCPAVRLPDHVQGVRVRGRAHPDPAPRGGTVLASSGSLRLPLPEDPRLVRPDPVQPPARLRGRVAGSGDDARTRPAELRRGGTGSPGRPRPAILSGRLAGHCAAAHGPVRAQCRAAIYRRRGGDSLPPGIARCSATCLGLGRAARQLPRLDDLGAARRLQQLPPSCPTWARRRARCTRVSPPSSPPSAGAF